MNHLFNGDEINQRTILGHPSGLFTLFFTEMWERFSYYGMRAILVLFLTSALIGDNPANMMNLPSSGNPGWGWERADALKLYAWYTGLVYITPIFGGIIADKYLGYRKAVIIGALLMTLGHASMFLEVYYDFYLYVGLSFLIIGNGFFKPNISSIVGQLYKDDGKIKDAAYTIFYMGINAGAFLGILLCGYIGEKVNWHLGFGLAGIFMFFGMLQFHYGQNIFGNIGMPLTQRKEVEVKSKNDITISRLFSLIPKRTLTTIIIAFLIILFFQFFPYFLIFIEISDNVYIFGNYLSVGQKLIYGVALTTVSWIIMPFITRISSKELISKNEKIVIDRLLVVGIFSFLTIFFWWGFEQSGGSMTIFANDYTNRDLVGTGALIFKIINTVLTVVPMIILTIILSMLFKNTFGKYMISNLFLGSSFLIIWAIVIWMLLREFSNSETEVPASWFAILNSFFIIVFAPILSKIWQTKYNPSGPVKFGIGLFLLATGFLILAYGSATIPIGAKEASASMIFLILAYLFHTLGELCISPVGLSYVSKLAPKNLVGLMFGVWFVANFIANYSAGITGSYIDPIVDEKGMSYFFLIFTILPAIVGILTILCSRPIVKMMHGVE